MKRGETFAIVTILLFIVGFALLVGLILYLTRSTKITSSCSSNSDCKSGLVCDTTMLMCLGELGHACSADTDCVTGTACTDGYCANVKTSAGPLECGDNLCTKFQDTNSVTVDVGDCACPSSPYYEFNGNYYCNGMFDELIVMDSSVLCGYEETIVDVVAYHGAVFFLRRSGVIIREECGHDNVCVGSNLVVEAMVAHGDILYGISGGRLYYLDHQTYNSNNWYWKQVDWFEHKLLSMSVTVDNNNLFLQTSDTAYLYNKNLEVITSMKFSSDNRRVYGRNLDTYIDINLKDHTAVFYKNNKCHHMRDMYSVVVTKNGVMGVDSSSEDYNHVKYVNDQVYYLTRNSN